MQMISPTTNLAGKTNNLHPSLTNAYGLVEHANTLISEAVDVFKSDNSDKKKRFFCEMLILCKNPRLPALARSDLTNKLETLSENRAFIGLNLAWANLTGCDLRGLNLSNANLTNVILTNAFLVETILVNANLTNATVTNAFLFKTDLRGAIVEGTNFYMTNLEFAYMDEPLRGIPLQPQAKPRQLQDHPPKAKL